MTIGDARVVLGRGPDHRRAADVDLLDERVELDARPRGGGRERVEVDDDELERRDGGGHELAPVVGEPAVGEDPAVDPRMERLDPPVEHLREAGHRGDVGDRQAGLAQRPGGAAGRDELEAVGHEPRRELDEAGLVADRQEGPPRDGQARLGPGDVDRRAPPVRRDRPGQQQADDPRQEPVLDRPDPLVQRSPRRRRRTIGTASWATIGPPSSVVVDEVDGRPADRRPVGQRVADRVGARERRQERGMRVDDPAGERGQGRRADDPHVAGQHDDVRARAAQRVGQRVVGAAGDEGRVDALLGRPVERRAGPVGHDEDDPPAELAPPLGGDERPEVAAGATHRDRDAALRRGLGSSAPARAPPSRGSGAHPPRTARRAPRPGRPRRPARRGCPNRSRLAMRRPTASGGTTAIIPRPPLNVARSSASSIPAAAR